MPSVRAGAVGTASIERNDYMMSAGPGKGAGGRWDMSQPATWSRLYFLAAIGYLAGMTLAAGGFRGSAGV